MKRNILVTLVLAALAAACYLADDSLHAPAQTKQGPAAAGQHRTLHDDAAPAPQAKRGWWSPTFYGRWPSQT
jgi:hypothetical protein